MGGSDELDDRQPEPGAGRGPSPLTTDRDCQTLQYALQSLASLALDEFAPDRAQLYL